MKTVLISGDAPPPAALRDIVARGSTALIECRAAELDGAAGVDADRVIFWSATDDPGLRTLAERLAAGELAGRSDSLLFVAAERAMAARTIRLAPDQLFVWPGDEDRLKIVFLTGA